MLVKYKLKRGTSAVTTIAASRNSGVLAHHPGSAGDFTLYLFLFFAGQILDRLTVELQLADLNSALLLFLLTCAFLLRYHD